jgi:hypothetical protein
MRKTQSAGAKLKDRGALGLQSLETLPFFPEADFASADGRSITDS